MSRFARRKYRPRRNDIVSPAKTDRATSQPKHDHNPQQVLGNQAMLRLLNEKAIQAKLKINEPGDKYEHEADRMAESIMHTPESQVQRQANEEEEETVQEKPLVGQISPMIQRQAEEEETLQAKPLWALMIQRQVKGEEEEEKTVQAKRQPGQTPTAASSIEGRISTMRGGGHPLSESARTFFEPRFGYDFSRVRVHIGSMAAQAADSIGAKAFTTGRDVVFGSKVDNPEASVHRQLLAHELTHVVQQDKSALFYPPKSGQQDSRILRPLSESTSAAPGGNVQMAPVVTGINVASELPVGGSIEATALVAPGTPSRTSLTWSIVGGLPAGVTITPRGRRGATIQASAGAAAGISFQIRCALTTPPIGASDNFTTLVPGVTLVRTT